MRIIAYNIQYCDGSGSGSIGYLSPASPSRRREMMAAYEHDVERCTELTQELYDQRSKGVKIKESIFRLASPVL